MRVLIAKLRKLLQDRKRGVVVILLVSIVVITIAALLPASELSISDSCEVAGPIQKLKSITQGKRYWVKQLQLLDKEIPSLERSLEFIRNFQNIRKNKKINDTLKQNEKLMEEKLYSISPELRPSPQQAATDEMQRQAAAIEEAQFLQTLEKTNAKRVKILKLCRPTILAATQ